MNTIVIVPMTRISLSPPSRNTIPPYSFIMSITLWENPTTLSAQSITFAAVKIRPMDPPNSGPKILDLENVPKFSVLYRDRLETQYLTHITK